MTILGIIGFVCTIILIISLILIVIVDSDEIVHKISVIIAILTAFTLVGLIFYEEVIDAKTGTVETAQINKIVVDTSSRKTTQYKVYTDEYTFVCYSNDVNIGDENEISFRRTNLGGYRDTEITLTPEYAEKIGVFVIEDINNE